MSQRKRIPAVSSNQDGPEILSLVTMEERKYQLRVTKEMMAFVKENGYNPLVDKTKIMAMAIKLLPQNDKEETALEFFMRAKKQSIKRAKKGGYTFHQFNSNKAINFKPKSFDTLVKESETSRLLNIKKKAATRQEVTA